MAAKEEKEKSLSLFFFKNNNICTLRECVRWLCTAAAAAAAPTAVSAATIERRNGSRYEKKILGKKTPPSFFCAKDLKMNVCRC